MLWQQCRALSRFQSHTEVGTRGLVGRGTAVAKGIPQSTPPARV